MSMDVGGAKGGVKSDINVTPLVDVMLVLLIIMMLIAPLLQKGVDVKLPTASTAPTSRRTQDQTVVAIDAGRGSWSTACRCREDDLGQRGTSILEGKKETHRPHQGRRGRAVRTVMDDHGQAAPGRHRGHGSHHRAQGGQAGGQ